MRHVLAIPLEEVRRHFEANERQSLKIVAPVRLGAELFARLRADGVNAKPEAPLSGNTWRHSAHGEANLICESRDFATTHAAIPHDGDFTISFGTERGPQDSHLHRRHAEIYFSEHALTAEYWLEGSRDRSELALPHGGALVFAAGVAHRVTLGGLTIVIEAPAVEGDKFSA